MLPEWGWVVLLMHEQVFNYMQACALPAVHLVRIRPVLLLG